MPTQRPRSIAICVFSHNGRILVLEGYDSTKREHFYRPIGGGIEYGEYSKDALIREIREEINAEIIQPHYLGTLENIYTFEGELGHEIVFVYDALFVDSSFYINEHINAVEDDATPFTVVWKPLAFFQDGSSPLYPKGLLELLKVNEGKKPY